MGGCARIADPIAAGEGDVTRFDFEDLIDRGIHVVQPDVAFCGRITVCRQVSDMCRTHNRPSCRIVQAPDQSGSIAALDFHLPSGDLIEYCLRPLRSCESWSKTCRRSSMAMCRCRTTRFGNELDPAIIDEFRVRY